MMTLISLSWRNVCLKGLLAPKCLLSERVARAKGGLFRNDSHLVQKDNWSQSLAGPKRGFLPKDTKSQKAVSHERLVKD